jgi:hypothetical protein
MELKLNNLLNYNLWLTASISFIFNKPRGKQVENAKGNGPKINILTIGSD